MTNTNGTQLRSFPGGLGGIGAPSHRGANAWRDSLQTLLVDALCGGVLGLLPARLIVYPGSPRRGSADPGLYSAAPLGLVCGGAIGREMALPVLRRILVNDTAEAVGVTEKVIGKLLEVMKV